jgi:hypothetical protein
MLCDAWEMAPVDANAAAIRRRRAATTAMLMILGIVVAVVGLGITRDPCSHSSVVACGSKNDQLFRASAGFVALGLGGASVALVLAGRRRLASVAVSLGGAACLAAVAEGLSHWSS